MSNEKSANKCNADAIDVLRCGYPEHADVEIPLTTRFHTWKTQPSGLGRIDAEDAEFAHFMELRDGPDGAFYRAYDAIEAAREFERSGEAASTWTSVNNCTSSNIAGVLAWAISPAAPVYIEALAIPEKN